MRSSNKTENRPVKITEVKITLIEVARNANRNSVNEYVAK
jgi:hypothetical protein